MSLIITLFGIYLIVVSRKYINTYNPPDWVKKQLKKNKFEGPILIATGLLSMGVIILYLSHKKVINNNDNNFGFKFY
jgi:hypothetical protein